MPIGGHLSPSSPQHPALPIGQLALPISRARGRLLFTPEGGSAYTPNQSTYRVTDFQQTNGPSFRTVVDVGNWDNSRAVNLPGQSGNPDSPHYRDLAPLWLKGEYFPLLYSRKAVEAATESRVYLVPAK